MTLTASSRSFETRNNVMDQKNLVKSPGQGVPPSLESLPTELQLQICREMLRSEEPITLSPCEPYVSGFAFGSLGILGASKYFSTMASSVMYGENCFHLESEDWTIEPELLDDYDDGTIHIKTLKHILRHSPWANLKNISHTLFGNVVSSVDCLDMISQTSSGQTYLKHLQINFGVVAWVRVMDGVLLRILKRMRGLQSVNLMLFSDWEDLIQYQPLGSELKWEEQNARDFLLLIKEELSHIKKITMEWIEGLILPNLAIIDWMAHELKKRNESWAPPLPAYKNFRRTFSPMSIVDAEVAKTVVQLNDKHRSKDHEHSIAHLERVYGVF